MIIKGIVNDYGFHRGRLAKKREEIIEQLQGLPDEFFADKGGGWSFLNAALDRDGVHWAEHPTMGMLFALGEAIGVVSQPIPREVWSALPGGMPYYVVDLRTPTA